MQYIYLLLGVPMSVLGGGATGKKMQSAEQLVLELSNPDLRENALLELSKKRELFQDLAPLLWNSFGTIAALLQEIVSIYPVLSPPNLTPAQSNRVCNALALLQCVASHPDTRMLFLNGNLFPFLWVLLNGDHGLFVCKTSLALLLSGMALFRVGLSMVRFQS
ncbi:hypothetical protein MTR67_052984 [Solanum verrucosum]|uniref:Uncharacterized protein n=1 Tax=Solanum verrucosum TaxID=315347 RepID=A0AAF1A3Y1_SOLVR|nr:hypothetical protein MTR67_052984 [Solanum verrucosum]